MNLRIFSSVFTSFLFINFASATEGIQFFEDKVKPIFEKHCNKCHGPEKEKGGLRLDLPEGINLGGDSGKIIDHHNFQKSSLLIAVKRLDEDLEMPPKNSLPAKDIAIIEAWVKMGAPLPKSANPVKLKAGYDWQEELKHWAFQTPKKSSDHKDIDQFIDSELKNKNLKANAPASKVELIRRAYFDVTGLPPSPEAVDRFLKDQNADAFEKVIDELLKSPHYGERWARHWLDVARYGDDQPYAFQQKKLNNAWKYRDWVVKAYNDDLPYTEFIRRQLAADLIQGLSPEQNAATGLIATGPMYFKRTEVLKALADELDDRVDVVSKAFLGLTVSCARCHDHKFDAIPTKDYYAMAGVFKSTRIYDRFVASDKEIEDFHTKLLKEGNLKSKLKELALKYHSPSSQSHIASFKNAIEIDDLDAEKKGSWKSSKYYKGFTGKSYLIDGNNNKGKSSITFPVQIKKSSKYELFLSYNSGDRARNVPVEIHHLNGIKKLSIDQSIKPPVKGKYISLGIYSFDSKKKGKVIISNKGTNGYVIADSLLIVPTEKRLTKVSSKKPTTYTGPSPIFSSDMVSTKSRDHRSLVRANINGLKEFYLVTEYEAKRTYEFHFHSWMNPIISNGNKTLKLTSLKPSQVTTDNKFYGAKFDTGEDAIICNGEVINHGFHCSGTTVLKFTLPVGNWQSFESEVGVFAKNGGAEKNNAVRFHIFKENPTKWLERRKAIKKFDSSNYLSTDTSIMSKNDAAKYTALKAKLKTSKPKLPPLVHGLYEGEIRDLKINIRGNPKKFGEVAPRGYLRILNSGKALDFKNGSGRLELANLIASPQNPLTARVMVNRIWHNLFGRGIVTSPSNFGKLGDAPSNQALLDFLAIEFMENNWSVKKMLKSIMLSKAYQRSSVDNKANAEIDGDNNFLWRQNMKRLDAESMRDSILTVAGKLNASLGGFPSGQKFDSSSFNRRMLYAKVSRTAPDSMRATFDFPSAANSAPKRNLTTVPQQKLFYLNSPFIMNMAKSLSKRIESHHKDPTVQLNFAFKLLYGRSPNTSEQKKLLPLIKDSKSRILLSQALLVSNEFSYID